MNFVPQISARSIELSFFFLFLSAPTHLPTTLPFCFLNFSICSELSKISRHHRLTEPLVTPSFVAIVTIEIPSFLIFLALILCSYFAIYVLYHRFYYQHNKNPKGFLLLLVAGSGLAPESAGYEPTEILLLYPASG